MRLCSMLDHMSSAWGSIRLGGRKTDQKLAAIDRGVLTVALLLAAIDGEILPEEYAAFEDLAKKCRGGTARNVRALLDQALRSAGYLMAMAQVGVYTQEQRLAAFVEAAVKALPRGFADGSMADLRRALVLWISIGVADGAYSDLERQAVAELAKPYAGGGRSLLEPRFLFEAERLVRDLSAPAKCAKAKAALEKLVSSAVVTDKRGRQVSRPAAKVGVRLALLSALCVGGAMADSAASGGQDRHERDMPPVVGWTNLL